VCNARDLVTRVVSANYPSHSLFFSLAHSRCVSLSLALSMSLYVSLSVSLSVPLSVALCFSLSVSLSLAVSLSLLKVLKKRTELSYCPNCRDLLESPPAERTPHPEPNPHTQTNKAVKFPNKLTELVARKFDARIDPSIPGNVQSNIGNRKNNTRFES